MPCSYERGFLWPQAVRGLSCVLVELFDVCVC